MIIRIDLETYSPIPIKLGVYKYSEQAEVLLMAYRINNGPTVCLDVYHDGIPDSIKKAIMNPDNVKVAFNAQFERIILSRHFKEYLEPKNWLCSRVAANRSGVIGQLGTVAAVIGKEQKDTEGKRLIKYFSIPCKPTKVNGGRTRNLPKHNLADWELFKKYCIADVDAEASLKVEAWNDLSEYELDSKINDRGIKCDIAFIENCVKAYETYKELAMTKLKVITGLENPNSNSQFSAWLSKEIGKPVTSLNKEARAELLTEYPHLEALRLKDALATSSVAKFTKMLEIAGKGDRIRGVHRHYEAHTGRDAGTLVQCQNLPGGDIDQALKEDIALWQAPTNIEVVNKLKGGNFVPSDLKNLIRPSLIPEVWHSFIICDFSAIEARVLAYLAGSKERIKVFEGDGKIYEYSAAKMFNIPIDTIVEGHANYAYRKKGKVAELALGYQGSFGALAQMGFSGTDDEALTLVKAWRTNNQDIVRMWARVQEKAKDAYYLKKTRDNFYVNNGHLFIKLLSGRHLIYRDFQINEGKMSYNRVKNNKYIRVETYGGKLVENIVQATARDLLFAAMLRLDASGYKIVLHVHDEVVIEQPIPGIDKALKDVIKIMCQSPDWAKGWDIRCSGLISPYYRK